MDSVKIEKGKVMNLPAAILGIGIDCNCSVGFESDSTIVCDGECGDCPYREFQCADIVIIGEYDLKAITKEIRHGSDKFLKQVLISFDLSAPMYFWNEYDSLNLGSEDLSIPRKDILENGYLTIGNNFFVGLNPSERVLQCLSDAIKGINKVLKLYRDTNNCLYLKEAIKMIPESFVRKRTIFMNYEMAMKVLKAGRFSRFDEEWDVFRDFLSSIPYLDSFMVAKYGH